MTTLESPIVGLIPVRGGAYSVDPVRGLVYGPRGVPIGNPDGSGHIQVDGRSRQLGQPFAHHLIWEAVHGPVPDGLEINHRNGIKADNRIANLEVVTRQQNVLHAYATGLKSNAGEKHPSHRLTEAQVREIRRRADGGEPHKLLAAEYGISRRQVNDVAGRRAWAHVTEESA
jgi:hypothetical protein